MKLDPIMEIRTRSKRRTGRLPDKLLNLQDSEFVGRDFSNQRINKLSVVNCKFVDCSFENIVFDQANFGAGGQESIYIDCSFAGAKITATAPGNVLFERCNFADVRIDEFIGLSAQFVDCTFSGNLGKCVFQGRIPEADQASVGRAFNEFYGNDFSQAKFKDVGFRGGIDLTKQKLPLNSDYVFIPDAEEFLRDVRESYLAEKDLKLREKVFSVIRILQFDVDEGQTQLYESSHNFPKSLRQTANTILNNRR